MTPMRRDWHQAAGKGRHVHQQEDIDGVSIRGQCPGKKAEIVRKDHAFRQDFAQSEYPQFGIVAVLIPGVFRRFDDDLVGAIGAWIERGGVG